MNAQLEAIALQELLWLLNVLLGHTIQLKASLHVFLVQKDSFVML